MNLQKTKEFIKKYYFHSKKQLLKKFIRTDPIIIAGMHRSGTTLLSRILEQLGVFLGNKKEENNEAIFFMKENERILRDVVHGAWDLPMPIKFLYAQPKRMNSLINYLRKRLNSFDFFNSFIGPTHMNKFLKTDTLLWGFKDPRNSLTWPIWQKIYPEAKYIFIYRNGIDVAASLNDRELRNLYVILNEFVSSRCVSLKESFDLWEEYNHIFFELLKENPKIKLLKICYENLLQNPQDELKKIAQFLKIEIKEKIIQQITAGIQSDKSCKFSQNPELLELYNRVKETPMMQKFGYDKLS